MITENLSTLKIHKLSKEQYERELKAGRIDPNALYLTPDEEQDLSLYATKEELNAKADAEHNHDESYYTKDEIDLTMDELNNDIQEFADVVVNTLSLAEKEIQEQEKEIQEHKTSSDAHSDIRDMVSELSTKVNNFLDVDDATTDQLSEVLTMIENNEGTIESLTSGKVNVSDIVDNLTTSNASKVLSAKQGVELKALIDANDTEVKALIDANLDAAKSDSSNKDAVVLAASQKYTDDEIVKVNSVIDTIQTEVGGKSDAVHNHDDRYYTETEIDSKIDDLNSAISGKSDSGHTHTVADTSNDGFMSAAMVGKLNNIAEGANKTIVDDALSTTSTNPVANSVVTSTLNTATSAILANTQSINAHNTAITNLQEEFDSIVEITSEEIQSLFRA